MIRPDLLGHSPMDTMLDRFNRAERERLLPVWRRAAWRLVYASIGGLIILVWAVATFWEAH